MSLLSRPARLALPVAVLALMGGATAAAAAVHPGPSPVVAHSAPSVSAGPGKASATAPFAWHPLTLENGWASASTKSRPTGTPAWAVRAGVVYLRGAVSQPGDGGSVLAQLPASVRPAHDTYLTVYTSGAVPGILYIGADGSLQAYDGDALAFTSLAGVSFLAKTVTTSPLVLENGWQSSQSLYNTGDPSYSVSGGVVHLSGSMHTAGTARLAFVLPKAARPGSGMYVLTYTIDGSTGWLHIQSTGQVYANGPDATGYTNLAGIAFPVATTKWAKLALTAGWKSAAGLFPTAAPEYAVVHGVVYLTGSMHQPNSGSGLWAFLPGAARTTGDVLEIEADTAQGTTGGVTVTRSLGLVSSTPFSNARAFTALAAIAYPPSS